MPAHPGRGLRPYHSPVDGFKGVRAVRNGGIPDTIAGRSGDGSGDGAMENVLGVIMGVSLLAAYRLFRARRPGDKPLMAVVLVLAGLAGAAMGFNEPIAGIVAAIGGLVVGLLPPYLAMAAQLARLRGEGRLSLWLERVAVLFQPGAIRRLHYRIAHTLLLARDRRLDPAEAMRRLGEAESLVGPGAAPAVVEGIFRLHAQQGDWRGLRARFERVGMSDEVLFGLPFGALSLVARAFAETGDVSTASRIVDHMAKALAENLPHSRSPGESGELPDAYLDRARIALLASLGADPSRFLTRGSALRPLFTRADRDAMVARAGAVPTPGSWSPDAGRIESLWTVLGIQKRLPTFLTSFQAPAPASAVLAAVSAAILLLVMATGSSMDAGHLLRAGACLADRVREGEEWRLFSSMFLHGGPVHLLVNAAFLIQVGNLAERLMGSWRFLAVYLVAGLSGALAAVVLGQPVVMVGASGAISGIFGAGAVMVFVSRGRLPRRWVNRNLGAFLLTFLANLFLGLALPMVSLSAHGGGFVAGIVATLVLLPARRLPGWLRRVGVVLVLVGWALAASWGIRGVAESWRRSVTDLVPLRTTVVRVVSRTDRDDAAQATIAVAHPATWARITRNELPGSPPGWLGAKGQLFRVEASCGVRWVRSLASGDEPLDSVDGAALLETVREANRDRTDLVFREGPTGWALVETNDPDGGVSITAHKAFPAGAVHLGYRFEPGSRDRELMEGMLEGTRLERCDSP